MPWPMGRTIATEALIVQRHQPPVDQEVRLIPSLVLDWVWRRGVEPLLVVCGLVACKAMYVQVTNGLICKLAWHVMLIHVRIAQWNASQRAVTRWIKLCKLQDGPRPEQLQQVPLAACTQMGGKSPLLIRVMQ